MIIKIVIILQFMALSVAKRFIIYILYQKIPKTQPDNYEIDLLYRNLPPLRGYKVPDN